MSNSFERKDGTDECLWKIVYSRDQSIEELRYLNTELKTQLSHKQRQSEELLEKLHGFEQELYTSQKELHQSQRELHVFQQQLYQCQQELSRSQQELHQFQKRLENCQQVLTKRKESLFGKLYDFFHIKIMGEASDLEV